MAPIPVGFAEIFGRIVLAGDSGEMGITFGVDIPAAPSQAIANQISTRVTTFLKAVGSSSYTMAGVRMTFQDETGPIIFDSVTGAGVGANAAACVPQNTAYLFTKGTAFGGRRNRGRMFVPGVREGDVDNVGVVLPATVTALNTSAATLLAGLVTDGNPMVLFHSEAPFTPPFVQTMLCQPVAATQRRRLR